MKQLNVIILSIFLFALSSTGVHAGDITLDEIVTNLQKNYQEMKDYEATFIQETKIKAYPRKQRSSGNVFYKKPSRMRWNYDKPEKSEIVTDGKTVWMYTPALNQVMKTDFSTSGQSGVATAFLSGMGNLKKDFNIKQGDDKVNYQLILTPKNNVDSVKTLILTVDKKRFNIIKSELTDLYENITTVMLDNFKLNKGLKKKLFQFVPPEGVDIVTQPKMTQ